MGHASPPGISLRAALQSMERRARRRRVQHRPGQRHGGGPVCGALGEDTGGSIRRPAANNSCVGLRPSWGRVSMYGVIPAVWSQDTAGPLTRTVADCALLMNVIAGYDPHDPLSARLPVPDYT